MKHKLFFSIFVTIFLASCNNEVINENKERQEIALSRSEEIVVNSEIDFSFKFISDLYGVELNRNGEGMNNILISPLSLYHDLSMLANGGSPNYQESVFGFLNLTDDATINSLNLFNKRIVRELSVADNSVDFLISNSLWVHNTVGLKQPFVNNISEFYNAATGSLDFNDRNAVDKINSWSNSSTKGMIPMIFEYGQLSSENVFALCNSIYFKGQWSDKILADNTENRLFYSQNGNKPLVATMESGCNGAYFGDDLTVVKKDYGNRAYSIYFVLPDNGVSLQTVMSELNRESWENIKSNLNYDSWTIRFPKFSAEYDMDLGGGEVVEALGLKEILFNPDLSEMSDDNIVKLKFIQKNTFGVDENGVEAATSSVFTGDPTCPMPSDTLTPIDINRPFMFLIEEYSTGTILFAGTILNL